MGDLMKVLKLARELARYAPILPALLELLAEARKALDDKRVSLEELEGFGARLVDLLGLVPRR